jgi:hypothetical protein
MVSKPIILPPPPPPPPSKENATDFCTALCLLVLDWAPKHDKTHKAAKQVIYGPSYENFHHRGRGIPDNETLFLVR